jgi:hypothetical protein
VVGRRVDSDFTHLFNSKGEPMNKSPTLSKEQAVEIARRYIAPHLHPGRSCRVTARRFDRVALDKQAEQIRMLGGTEAEVESVLQSDALTREHWAVCFFPPDEEPETASTAHASIVLVFDSGEARFD